MAAEVNFNFFMPPAKRKDDMKMIPGVRFRDLRDKLSGLEVGLPTLIVGPTPKKPTDVPAKWAKIIPPDFRNRPAFAHDTVIYGSIVDQQVGHQLRKVMTAHQDEAGTQYVLIRLGLQFTGDGTNKSQKNHLLDLLAEDIKPVKYGVYSFDRKSLELAAAREDKSIGVLLGDDTSIRMGRVAAERIDMGKSTARQIQGLSFPASDFSLWKMPKGSVLLGRDIDGSLFRVVAERNKARPVDASGYAEFYELLERAGKKKLEIEVRKADLVLPTGHPDA